MIGRGEAYVSQDINDQVVPVLGKLPQSVQCFFKDPEVVRTGARTAKGWMNN